MPALLALTLALTTATERYAIIVGNNASADPDLAPLAFADDDAALHYELWTRYAEHVALLTVLDDETQRRHPGLAALSEPPTRAHLDHALADTFARIREARERRQARTQLVFIYVGHGAIGSNGKGLVHLADGVWQRDDLFHDLVAASPADVTHIFIDACHAYSLIAGRGPAPHDTVAAASAAVGDEPTRPPSSAEMAALDGFLAGHDLSRYPSVGALLATSDNRETHEWARLSGGLFSYALRSALLGAADVNGDGLIEYSEVAAFIDAAYYELRRGGQRVSAFAWPPQRDRRTPILDVRRGRDTRLAVFAAEAAGHFVLATETSERWAELNKAAGTTLALALPATSAFFVSDGRAEIEVPAGASTFALTATAARPLALARRGPTEAALERGWFAVPFTEPYYRGFVSAQPTLLPVPAAPPPAGAVASTLTATPTGRATGPAWSVSVAYGAGSFALARGSLEHSFSVQLSRHAGGGLWPSLALEAAYAPLAGVRAGAGTRGALLLGIGYEQPLVQGVALVGEAALGVGAIGLHAAGDDSLVSSYDPLVGVGRLRAGLGYAVTPRLGVRVTGGADAQVVTLDGEERLRLSGDGAVAAVVRF